MTIEEIKAFLAENAESEDVKAFVAELTPKVTPELVTAYLGTEDGERLLKTHPATDARVTQGVKTAVEKERAKIADEVQRLVAAEKLKLNPAETPEQKQIRELTEQFNAEKEARAKETLQRQLIEEAATLKVDILPILQSGYLPPSLEQGKVFLQEQKKIYEALEAKVRNDLVANGSFKPGSGDGNKRKVDLDALTPAQMLELEKSGELDKILAGA